MPVNLDSTGLEGEKTPEALNRKLPKNSTKSSHYREVMLPLGEQVQLIPKNEQNQEADKLAFNHPIVVQAV